MIYDVNMIRGDECGLNFLTCVLQLRKIPEKYQPESCPDWGYSMDTLDERQRRYLLATAVVGTFNKTILFFLFHLTFREQYKYRRLHLHSGPGFYSRSGQFPNWCFLGVSLNGKTNVRKFRPYLSQVSFDCHTLKPYSSVYRRRRSLSLAVVHGCK